MHASKKVLPGVQAYQTRTNSTPKTAYDKRTCGDSSQLKSLSRTLSVRLCIKLKCHISFHVLNDYAGNISVNHVWSVVGVFIVISDAVFTVTDTSTVIFQCHTNPSVSHGLGSVTVNE